MIGAKPLPGNMGKVYVLPMGLQIIEATNEPGGAARPIPGTEVEDEDLIDEDDEHLSDADVETADEDDEEVVDDAEAGKTSSIIIARR